MDITSKYTEKILPFTVVQMEEKDYMKNVEITQEGTKLIITVDLSKEFGRSASGKTTIVATTEGNQKVGDVYIGLNVYKK